MIKLSKVCWKLDGNPNALSKHTDKQTLRCSILPVLFTYSDTILSLIKKCCLSVLHLSMGYVQPIWKTSIDSGEDIPIFGSI
jgi:hypothetical protein